MHHPVLETTLLVLLVILIVNIVFRAICLPVILGYLVVGAAVGPHVLGWVPDTQAIKYLAELGVVLLMFTIGLEFSLTKLITLRYAVFMLGGLQVTITILFTVLIGFLIQMSLVESIVIGCVVAMSSTALVIKQLSEQLEIHARHGLNAIGILLFQDLAVIPILIVIASLGTLDEPSLWETLFLALLRGVVAIILILVLGRWLLKPLFHMIASIKAGDLFTLTVLFVALGSAWISNILGMTYSLGAFLSGIMLGETEFRQQIKNEIRPFRDVLLGLFFVSVGMLANINIWLVTWHWIIVALLAIMLGKAMLIILLVRFSKYDAISAIRTGLILAQGGEFGFAILALALESALLPLDYGQVLLAALLISFAQAPLMIRYNEVIAKKLFPKSW